MLTRRNITLTGLSMVGISIFPSAASHAARHTSSYGTKHHAKGHKNSRKRAYNGDYQSFLSSIRSQALAKGIDAAILDQALALDGPNQHVLQLSHHQPEFTLTWAQYREKVLTSAKLANARRAYEENQALLHQISDRYQVDPKIILGIWGVESAFGTKMGTFNIIDALGTLSYSGRRAAFFKSELFKALHILNNGDTTARNMLGSYAGAMGQPQFMPSAYMRFAVDFDGDGRRNIWTSRADSLASVANYLAGSGWQAGQTWGEPIQMPASLSSTLLGRSNTKSLQEWDSLGVKKLDGSPFNDTDLQGAIIQPDGPGTESFMVYHNFNVIRRYNPSDYYSLGVGLLGDSVQS